MSADEMTSGRIIGSLRSAGGMGVVRIEARFDSPIEELWSALSDPRRLAEWHAKVDGELHSGGRFRIYVESDDWEGVGRVDACEPPRRFLVTTRESDESWEKGQGVPPFDEVIEVTLTADGTRTFLVAEVRGLPLEAIAFYGAGWQLHAERLSAYLAGRERDDTGARFEELVPTYQALAAEIGT